MFHVPDGKMLVTGGNFTSVFGNVYHGPVHQELESPEGAMKRLYEYVASGAIHDSGERFDAPKCHPDTRVAILERIMKWIGTEELDELVLWLYGAAGAGKSAIMQTIAMQLEQEGRLSASFFFVRTGTNGRNDDTRFAATLAYQISKHIPETKAFIAAAMNADPGLFQLPLQSQLDLLVIKPLLRSIAPNSVDSGANEHRALSLPRVIIVDGLDECLKPESQKIIIRALSALSDQLKHAIPHRVIIASRPEYEIKSTFNSISPLQKLHLNEQWKPSEDIRNFLESSFEELKTTHPLAKMIPKYWPSSRQYDKMVDNSSEHFIYSATLFRYVKSPRHDPRKRLERVLEPTPDCNSQDNPFADLDNLYLQVLSAVEPEHIETVLLVLRMALIGSIDSSWQLILPSKTIQLFLELDDGELELSFIDLESVLTIYNTTTESTLHEPSTRLLHASFLDFLLDKTRSKDFWINDPRLLRKMMQRCVDLLWKDRRIYIFEHWNLCILCLPHFSEHLADRGVLKETLLTLDVPSMMEFIIEYKHFPSFTPFRTRPFLEWAIQATMPDETPSPSTIVGQLKSAISSALTLTWNKDSDITSKSPILVGLKSWITQTLSKTPFTTQEGDTIVEESSRGEYLHKLHTGYFSSPPLLLDDEVVDYAVDLLVVMRYYRRSYRKF